jgi:hypothetical protein
MAASLDNGRYSSILSSHESFKRMYGVLEDHGQDVTERKSRRVLIRRERGQSFSPLSMVVVRDLRFLSLKFRDSFGVTNANVAGLGRVLVTNPRVSGLSNWSHELNVFNFPQKKNPRKLKKWMALFAHTFSCCIPLHKN